ncbi:hypothetical protein, partial [Sphingobacterium multivorum]|uniref:hypothetical protein n=1 Tax=Sphingobacterium multivorum TaxID=28454 RepID=UPI0028AAD947
RIAIFNKKAASINLRQLLSIPVVSLSCSTYATLWNGHFNFVFSKLPQQDVFLCISGFYRY